MTRGGRRCLDDRAPAVAFLVESQGVELDFEDEFKQYEWDGSEATLIDIVESAARDAAYESALWW